MFGGLDNGGRNAPRRQSKYTDKQKRKAEHIEEGYEDRGVPKKEAEGRAWATVNKESGGGNKSGSGRGKKDTHVSSSRGGRAHKSGSSEQRTAAARKGWVQGAATATPEPRSASGGRPAFTSRP